MHREAYCPFPESSYLDSVSVGVVASCRCRSPRPAREQGVQGAALLSGSCRPLVATPKAGAAVGAVQDGASQAVSGPFPVSVLRTGQTGPFPDSPCFE